MVGRCHVSSNGRRGPIPVLLICSLRTCVAIRCEHSPDCSNLSSMSYPLKLPKLPLYYLHLPIHEYLVYLLHLTKPSSSSHIPSLTSLFLSLASPQLSSHCSCTTHQTLLGYTQLFIAVHHNENDHGPNSITYRTNKFRKVRQDVHG